MVMNVKIQNVLILHFLLLRLSLSKVLITKNMKRSLDLKTIAKITNKIIALKPIAPTSGGPCAPDPTSISLSTIPNEMIPEKIIINETKEKNK